MPGDEPRDDRGDQPGRAQRLGGQCRQERRRQRDEAADVGVGDAGADHHDEVGDHESQDGRDHDGEGEVPDDAPHGQGRACPDDGGPQQDEGGGVVEQPLALEDRDHALRGPESLDDGGGHRVGRAEDRAERQAPAEPDTGEDQGEEEAEDDAGGHHEDHGEPADGAELPPEVHGGHRRCRGVEQRGQHCGQQYLGRYRDGRHPGEQAGRTAEDHQQQRPRDPQPCPDGRDGGDREDTQDDPELEWHRTHLRTGSSVIVGTERHGGDARVWRIRSREFVRRPRLPATTLRAPRPGPVTPTLRSTSAMPFTALVHAPRGGTAADEARHGERDAP